jgi:hypothetical protein
MHTTALFCLRVLADVVIVLAIALSEGADFIDCNLTAAGFVRGEHTVVGFTKNGFSFCELRVGEVPAREIKPSAENVGMPRAVVPNAA